MWVKWRRGLFNTTHQNVMQQLQTCTPKCPYGPLRKQASEWKDKMINIRSRCCEWVSSRGYWCCGRSGGHWRFRLWLLMRRTLRNIRSNGQAFRNLFVFFIYEGVMLWISLLCLLCFVFCAFLNQKGKCELTIMKCVLSGSQMGKFCLAYRWCFWHFLINFEPNLLEISKLLFLAHECRQLFFYFLFFQNNYSL